MSADLYNKEDKAGSKQQLKYRLAMLEDNLHFIEKTKIEILADIVFIKTQLFDE